MQGWIWHRRLAWQILNLSRVRWSIHAHKDTTSPPAMVAVVFPLPPFPPNLYPHSICPSSVVVFVDFPPPPLSPHLMLIVRSHLLQHQRVSLLLSLAAKPMPPPNMTPQHLRSFSPQSCTGEGGCLTAGIGVDGVDIDIDDDDVDVSSPLAVIVIPLPLPSFPQVLNPLC